MRRRRVAEFELNRHDSIARGPGMGQILVGITGRPPMYFPSRRGYGVQERTARDAIAACERLGYDIVVTGPRAQVDPDPITMSTTPTSTESADDAVHPDEVLW